MISFRDILYRKIDLPDWLEPFIKLPEIVRLRGVRLSNVDSYQFKDFNSPTRWEHSLAVAYLASRCAQKRQLDEKDTVHLILGALFHDVATPPFAHTVEQAISGFDHELEGQRLSQSIHGSDLQPRITVFASQLPKFTKACKSLSRKLHWPVNVDEVGRIVLGEGHLGFLVNGTIDLDNIDNVVRSSLYTGARVDPSMPLALAEWLANQSTVPLALSDSPEPLVKKWLVLREELYRSFYESSYEELGRQAFLQHIMRRALAAGFPRTALIWNTDEKLLSDFEGYKEDLLPVRRITLSELVQRYRLLEAVHRVAQVEITTREDLRMLARPDVIQWIETELAMEGAEFCVMVSVRRYQSEAHTDSLFPPPAGLLIVFKLGSEFTRDHLPAFIKTRMPVPHHGTRLRSAFSSILGKETSCWLQEKPWLRLTTERKMNVVENLKHIGDWGFRGSSNVGNNVHPYPATFVHAIPAALISALGLRGELIIDPFGGTGNTAVEAVRYGSPTISADTNSIACLVAKAKLTYLRPEARSQLKGIKPDDLKFCRPFNAPALDKIEKWFNPKTLDELCRIWQFVEGHNNNETGNILKAAFSATLPVCTGRRGKEHGWFADNTPLPKGTTKPPYQDALTEFVRRVRQNVMTIERLYGTIERDGREPSVDLKRAVILKLDATVAQPRDYGLEPGSVAGVLTSPPYLCMADYTLGQRLSYAWIAPNDLAGDFQRELGARRLRTNPEKALEQYVSGLRAFAKRMAALLCTGGFLAVVLAAPTAKAFCDKDVLGTYDAALNDAGFDLLWDHWRDIHWHRNYGYAKLRQERISVHVKT